MSARNDAGAASLAAQGERLRSALRASGARLPAAVVDLDALERNVDRHAEMVRPRGTPLRVASKSVRSVEVLTRVLDRGGALFNGALCFAAREMEFLARRGVRDLLLAYPVFQSADLDAVARANDPSLGCTARAVVDSAEGLARLGDAAQKHGVRVPVVLCVDMALAALGGAVYLGVRRSPLRDERDVVRLARKASVHPALRFEGLMGYEAQVAGLGDASPHDRWMNPAKSLVRRLSVRDVARRRAALVAALAREGLPCALVNGGGSGSLDTSTPASGVTEVAAGSGFYKPVLFDYYEAPYLRAHEPAAFFALEVTRAPGEGFVTCLGGGYVASGPPGLDRVPLPVHPPGLELLPGEMTGEVQTPLRVTKGARAPSLGECVLFRHAKAGELMERFEEIALVRGDRIEATAKTYRGDGQCYF